MQGHRTLVVGASGYSGAIVSRLVAAHPAFSLAAVTSDKLAGKPATQRLGAGVSTNLVFSKNGEATELSRNCDLVFLATPAEASAELVPHILEYTSAKVVDLSGAFRLENEADYPTHYNFTHPSAALLNTAHYGLPELFGPPPAGTRLISNPGCYPTATLLALAPLVKSGLVETTGLIVDAKSGVSGAGVQAKEEYSFVEIAEDLRAYKVLSHQHTPEIKRHLSRAANTAIGDLTFTPHLIPIKRGLLSTCYARPKPGVTPKQIEECFANAYSTSAFVDVVAPAAVTLKSVAGTNRARVGFAVNSDVVIAIGAIDNLVKGAAGQAVQNANLLFGLPETMGLSHLEPLHP
ncbi:MAG: N-acetyl-gamma-glutamyl-phosphate reductase [Polyangiaceae bacterium]|nr:N-acetyl-gamma-glutamyl-phosphate reductase [Polyangiaceae bacterium]